MITDMLGNAREIGAECNFCLGGKQVRGNTGVVQCPECRGTGLQSEVNDHLTVTLECQHCHLREEIMSHRTSVGLALTQFAKTHLGCQQRELRYCTKCHLPRYHVGTYCTVCVITAQEGKTT